MPLIWAAQYAIGTVSETYLQVHVPSDGQEIGTYFIELIFFLIILSYEHPQMMKSRKHYRYLKNQVGSSQNTVHLTATGHVRPRPLTAPNLEKYEQSEKSSIYTAHSQHKLSVADMVRDYIHTPASRFTKSGESSKL